MSVAEAQARISSREYAEWIAFYALSAEEPEPSDDEMAAKAAAFAGRFRDPGTVSQERR
jgi:hypothetical protein